MITLVVLHAQVAQEGLSRCSVVGSSDGSIVGDNRAVTRSSGLGSYPEIHVPVYAAVKGVCNRDTRPCICCSQGGM